MSEATPSSAVRPFAGARRLALRVHPLAVLALLLVCVMGLDAWWLDHFRRGYPLDTDESAYVKIAFDYAAGWRAHGPSGLWQAFVDQRSQAPLVPLAAVPIALVHQGILPTFGVELGFLALLGLATYGVARELAGRWFGVLAAVLVLALPGITDFTRVFIFALPATAMSTAAIYALMRSHALQRTRWAVAFGALLGLCVLTRTMMIALVPGALVAAAIQVAARREGRARGTRNLVLGVTAGCGIAAIWLVHSWTVVTDYLTSAGYGTQALQHGRSSSVLTLIVDVYLYAPAALLLAGASVAAIGSVAKRLRDTAGATQRLRLIGGSGAFVLLVVLGEGWAALESSRNPGFGFELPLIPPIVLLAVWSLARIQQVWIRRALTGCLLAVSAFNLISKADVWRAASGTSRISLPILSSVQVADGESLRAGELRRAGYTLGPPTRRWPAILRRWQTVERDTAYELLSIARAHRRAPVVFLGSRDPLFNTNSIGLAARLYFAVSIPLGQLDPTVQGDTVAAYQAQLSDPVRGQPNLLVLSAPGPGEFQPPVDQSLAEQAARLLGFRRVFAFALPDGRRATIMWLDRGPPA